MNAVSTQELRSGVGRAPRWSSVALFLAATWLISPVLLLSQRALRLDSEVLAMVQFAPGVGALVVAGLRRHSDPQVGSLLRRGVRIESGTTGRAACGVAVVTAVIGIAWALESLVDHRMQAVQFGGFSHPLLLILTAQMIGAGGEELGWRGFLLPYLQRKYSSTAAAGVVGVAWASWHVQYYGSGPVFIFAFVATCVAMTSLMATFQQGRRCGAWYVASSMHWALNIGILLVVPVGGTQHASIVCLAVVAVTAAVLARRLSPSVTNAA